MTQDRFFNLMEVALNVKTMKDLKIVAEDNVVKLVKDVILQEDKFR